MSETTQQTDFRKGLGKTLAGIEAVGKQHGPEARKYATAAAQAISNAGQQFYAGKMNAADFEAVMTSYTAGGESLAARAIAAAADKFPDLGKAITDGVGMLIKLAQGLGGLFKGGK